MYHSRCSALQHTTLRLKRQEEYASRSLLLPPGIVPRRAPMPGSVRMTYGWCTNASDSRLQLPNSIPERMPVIVGYSLHGLSYRQHMPSLR